MYSVRGAVNPTSMSLAKKQNEEEVRGLWSARAASLICVLLLSLLTFVQVAHVHPAASDADHCSICVAMHSAAPVAVVAPPVVFTTGIAPVPVPVVPAVVRRWHYTMFNRPPPDVA